MLPLWTAGFNELDLDFEPEDEWPEEYCGAYIELFWDPTQAVNGLQIDKIGQNALFGSDWYDGGTSLSLLDDELDRLELDLAELAYR